MVILIPQSLLGDARALEKTLLKSLNALMRRLERTKDKRIGGFNWSVHQGSPKDTNLPDADAAVWLAFSTLLQDPQQPFQADGFHAIWHLRFVLKDAGTDQYGFDQARGFQALGGVFRVLSETMDDVSLDSSVDDVELVSAEQVIGTIANGDREISEWLLVIRAWHPLVEHSRV